MKIIKKIFSSSTLLIIQLILTGVFSFYFFNLNILNNLLATILICIALFVLWMLMWIRNKQKKKNGKKRKGPAVLSFFLSVILILSSLLMGQGYHMLESLSRGQNSSYVKLYVKNDQPFDKVKNATDLIILKSDDRATPNLETAIQEIQKVNPSVTNINNIKTLDTLIDSFNDGNGNALLLDHIQGELLMNQYPEVFDQLKVIYKYRYENQQSVVDNSFKAFIPQEGDPDASFGDIIVPEITKNPKVVNIYVAGIDTRYGGPGDNSLTDTNMILTINPTTGTVLMTSIPRDYYLFTPCSNGMRDKLTHAGMYGVDCSIKTLESLLSIDINYYVKVNFSGFAQIVDALDGIYVTSDYAFTTGNYSFVQGSQLLNGDEALAFARERHKVPGGDRTRMVNQQRVVTGIINRALSSSIISNFTDFMNSINGAVATDMSVSRMTSFASMGTKIEILNQSVDGVNGENYTASYPNNPTYVMYPSVESLNAAIAKIKSVEAK